MCISSGLYVGLCVCVFGWSVYVEKGFSVSGGLCLGEFIGGVFGSWCVWGGDLVCLWGVCSWGGLWGN